MKEESNRRKILLDKANGVTSLLALLTAGVMIPGAIWLFRFLTDATDGVIEMENLIGWGDFMLPGGIAILEPYATLTLLVAAVGIPLLLLIALLVKKGSFSRGTAPGTGVFWFAILVGAAVIFTALGFTAMLLNGSPGGIDNIDSAPLNLGFAAVGILMVISAVYAISMTGQAKSLHEPELVNGTVDETGETHYRQTLPADTEPIAIDREGEEAPAPESVSLIDVPYDRPRIEQTVTIPVKNTAAEAEAAGEDVSDTLVQDETTDPEEEFRADVAMSEAGPIPDGVAVEEGRHEEAPDVRDPSVEGAILADPIVTESGPVPDVVPVPEAGHHEERAAVSEDPEALAVRNTSHYEGTAPAVSEDPEGVAVRETSFFESGAPEVTEPERVHPGDGIHKAATVDSAEPGGNQPSVITEDTAAKEQFLQNTKLQEEGGFETEHRGSQTDLAENTGSPVIKRRFLKFPGDENKVIVLFREFAGNEVIREWAEIRPRSEFNQKIR